MDNPSFKNTSALWVRYDKYEFREDARGMTYIIPVPGAKPVPYDPMKSPEQLALDAVNTGMLMMRREKKEVVKQAVFDFVSAYGLLGFMTALPTTPKFIDYNAVYLPTNHFITAETMTTEDYIDVFFPFEKLDFVNDGKESRWNINEDRDMVALGLTFGNSPTAVIMGFMRNYAERYDWICTQLKDLAFSFSASFLYYNDYDHIDETTRELYQQGMTAFGGITPTYRIYLKERPTLVWDFYSLLSCVQMMFSFMLTDEAHPLKVCKTCSKAFIPSRPNILYCSPECKNKHSE